MAITLKLTANALDQLAKAPPSEDVFDTDLPGYHVRPGKRGLTFRLYYRTKAGKQRILTLGRYGTLTAAQARKNAKEALAVVAQGGDPRALLDEAKAERERQDQQTLSAYLTGPYTAFQNRRKDGKGTLDRIARDFADWLDKPMGSLSRADVERWQANQEAAKKPRAFATLKRSYDALSALLAHAAERKVIPAHPLKGVKLQKPAFTEEELAEQGSERRYLLADEVEALFAGLEAYQDEKRQQRRSSREHGKAYLPDLERVAYVDHVAPWILTMFYTGFRPGDLFGLRWEHVNLTFATIRKTIEKTAHKRPEPQTFPLSGSAVEVLKTWHKQQGQPTTGFVFPSPRTGNRLDRTAMQKPWASVRKMARLPDDLQLYTLRHNFASQLVMGGTDILTVSKLMAHSSIETTIKFYAHLAPDHKRDAVEAFAKLAPGHDSAADQAVQEGPGVVEHPRAIHIGHH
ncbi:site-specific integrase [Billgrantia ethanolica]|uniref:Site-specific integrase n=1 Tax=Billgrantia ethanolica TaxID=2733486 RepID=A0ABS9A024_9GAMM|nr:site-specific integrase [Halomonas ethanolica]MCE8002163.1 site-specific integrase [Halomonas ethanolica]